MKIALVSRSDLGGGAARAAFRLHRALIAAGDDSRMFVGLRQSGLDSVVAAPGRISLAWDMLRPALAHALVRQKIAPDGAWRSIAWLPGFLPRRLLAAAPNVVNLHWVGDETLSVSEIARLARTLPLVWTLHDMWPFCGAEHYAAEDTDATWRKGADQSDGVDAWTWCRKERAWRDIPPIHLIAPSRWIAACAEESALMRDWPRTVIPNPLDTERFRPLPRSLARDALGLPQQVPLVLFGRFGGDEDKRKGWDLLRDALGHLARSVPTARCVVIGQNPPAQPPDFGLPVHWLGMLHDDVSLALAYSAADVTIVPSRQDNLPQLATEAQSCGCPVAAFAIGGLADIVEHCQTGYLAAPFNVADLARGVAWILEDLPRHATLAAEARSRAVRLWSPEAVIPPYIEAYRIASADFYARGGR